VLPLKGHNNTIMKRYASANKVKLVVSKKQGKQLCGMFR